MWSVFLLQSCARTNNTLTRACTPQPIRQQRPQFLCLAQKFSGRSSLCRPLKLAQPKKQTRSEDVCLPLGRVAIPQREQRYVTTVNIPGQHHGWHRTVTTVLIPMEFELEPSPPEAGRQRSLRQMGPLSHLVRVSLKDRNLWHVVSGPLTSRGLHSQWGSILILSL